METYTQNKIIDNKIIEVFKKKLENNNLGQGYILYGADETIKANTVIELFKFLNCKNNQNFSACDNCSSCKKVNNNFHPDLIEIKKEKEYIGIEQILQISDMIKYTNFEAKYRFIIIYKADEMTIEAANSFLKILEEPPQNTFFFLFCNDKNKLLLTIISRCNILEVTNYSYFELLKDKEEIGKEKIKSITNFSNNYDELKNYYLTEEYIEFRDTLIKKIISYINNDFKYADFINYIRSFYNFQKRLKEKEKKLFYETKIFEILISFYRDIYYFQKTNNFEYLINVDYKEEIMELCKNKSEDKIIEMIFLIFEYCKKLYNNLNLRILLNELFLIMEEKRYG
ncbi:MAG TPA: hypothetical protein PLD27_00320 [bacterium]|nr:hypothetical protein [bacterium]HOL48705.1 hypothetical protein [bacterium]HPQ18129.1 hypothetical protein [bacterium]